MMEMHAQRAPVEVLRLVGVRQWQVTRDGVIGVADAAAWLTRDGDPDDHVLMPGQTLAVRRGDRLTAEPWQAGHATRLLLARTPRPVWQQAAWHLLARLAAGLGTRLLAWSRSADLHAC